VLIVITVMVAVTMTLSPHIFKLLVTFVCLWAVLTVTLDSQPQFLLSLVNTFLATLIIAIGARENGASQQPSDRQQSDKEHSLRMGHLCRLQSDNSSMPDE
jgi:hypothetical protein